MPKSLAPLIQHHQNLLQLKLYLVGGSVRDKLLSIEHTDPDFATPAHPDDIVAAVKQAGFKPLTIGKKFGTIGFIDRKNDPKNPIEITTFRTEIYGKSRKPQVTYVQDIGADLSRRDFTVNALAVDEKGRIIDPFSGYADLKSGTIRFVGNPSIRINEDPLRMLRACRLAAQFAFISPHDTRERIHQNAHKILNISKERWTQELDKILISKYPHRGLDMLAQTELLRFILPEIWIQYHYDQNSPYHRLSLFEHTKKTVQLVKADPLLRWAALLHDVGKPFARTTKCITKRHFFIGTLKRWWKKDTQSNYPYHAELGAEFVTKIGIYLRWSKERTSTIKNLVLRHLSDESPIDHADGAAR